MDAVIGKLSLFWKQIISLIFRLHLTLSQSICLPIWILVEKPLQIMNQIKI